MGYKVKRFSGIISDPEFCRIKEIEDIIRPIIKKYQKNPKYEASLEIERSYLVNAESGVDVEISGTRVGSDFSWKNIFTELSDFCGELEENFLSISPRELNYRDDHAEDFKAFLFRFSAQVVTKTSYTWRKLMVKQQGGLNRVREVILEDVLNKIKDEKAKLKEKEVIDLEMLFTLKPVKSEKVKDYIRYYLNFIREGNVYNFLDSISQLLVRKRDSIIINKDNPRFPYYEENFLRYLFPCPEYIDRLRITFQYDDLAKENSKIYVCSPSLNLVDDIYYDSQRDVFYCHEMTKDFTRLSDLIRIKINENLERENKDYNIKPLTDLFEDQQYEIIEKFIDGLIKIGL